MSRLQEAYNELQKMRREKREISKAFQDELAARSEYQKILEQLKVLKEKKKGIESDVKSCSLKDARKLDDLRVEIQSQQELISDLSLNMYISKQNVEVVDEADRKYVPCFSVKFKRE